MFENNNGSSQNFPNHNSSNNEASNEQQYQQNGFYHYQYPAAARNSGEEGQAGSSKPPKQKKNKSGPPWYVKLIAGAAACIVVSAGSIGGFVAMVNAGIVTLNAPSQFAGTNPASNSNKNNGTVQQVSKENSEGALSLQEVAAKVTPSVVCIQNYQGSRLGQ